MSDPTESARRDLNAELRAQGPLSREQLERAHGQVWTTDELRSEFSVLGFLAPLVIVRRNADGVKGSLMFQHDPRLYFAFEEHRGDPD